MSRMMRGGKLAVAATSTLVALSLVSCGGSNMTEAKNMLKESEFQPDGNLGEILDDLMISERIDLDSSKAATESKPFGDESQTNSGQYSPELFPFWVLASDAFGWTKGTNVNCSARLATMFRDGDDLTWLNERACIIDQGGSWTDSYGTLDDDGDLEDPISGGNPAKFEVDHIVQTRVAWQSGANGWDQQTRELFSNDPLNLQTTSTKAMYQKNAEPVDGYIPPGPFQCEYVSRYIQVKDKYKLSVTQEEHDVLVDRLSKCGV